MASIKPYKNGWRVHVQYKGKVRTKTFGSKREAQQWADAAVTELRAEAEGTIGEIKTMADAMDRYAAEIAPTHKGEQWEIVRLTALREFLPVTLPLSKITSEHFEAFKKQRLQSVSAGTVLREFNLLGSVLAYARRDWKWMKHSPISDVRKPSKPAHRERVITWRETRVMLRALGYRWNHRPASQKEVAAYVFLISLRTGMRAGEICGMQWQHVHDSWVTLPDTKNGTARDVPLSRKVRRLFRCLRSMDDQLVCPITTQSLDVLFRRARVQAGLSGFVFHDARHTAATRIGATVGQPGRVTFPEFVKIFGWRDPKFALVYVNPSAAALAEKL